jgi:hypothetical protein
VRLGVYCTARRLCGLTVPAEPGDGAGLRDATYVVREPGAVFSALHTRSFM